MRLSPAILRALAVALVLSVAGCSRGPVKVEGYVTLDGKPLSRANVSFTPVDGSGNLAAAQTRTDGYFRLTTFKEHDGAMPGDYKVSVTILDPPVEIQAQPGWTSKEMMAALAKAMAERRKNPLPPLPKLPLAVQDPMQTPLRQQVPPKGPVLLELTSSE